MSPSGDIWLGSPWPPLCGSLTSHIMIKEDICAEGKVPEPALVPRAGEPVLRRPCDTPPHLKLHPNGLHLMCVITKCIVGRDMAVKNKLYNILLSITRASPAKTAQVFPAVCLHNLSIALWTKMGVCAIWPEPTAVSGNVPSCLCFLSPSNKTSLLLCHQCVSVQFFAQDARTWDLLHHGLLRPPTANKVME
jgi:hypothetical protein